MEIHFKIIGILLMALAFVHVIFPSYFNWKEEMKSLSLINRQIMAVHTFFIALSVFLMGLLCFACADDLISTKLGKTVTFGLGIFWSIRLLVQFFGYSTKLWKGKTFETIVHIVFTLLWIYLSAVLLWSAFSNIGD